MLHPFKRALAGRPLLLDERFLADAYGGGRSSEAPTFQSVKGVAVVSISGPMTHHEERSYWSDPPECYDSIRERVTAAFESRPRAVVLYLDTPGGECSGCFELAADMRKMSATSGIPLYAAVDGMACSAGYALACAASRIFAPKTAIVGSIGVITGILDATRALENFGLHYEVIASGDRKGDGHPAKPLDDGARTATKGLVMGLADVFFAWVSTSRPALSPDAVRALQAGIVLGKDAVAAGLIDQVATLDEVIAIASRPAPQATPAPSAGPYRTPGGLRAPAKKETRMRTKAENENGETQAEMESCDLTRLREVMEMPDQPAQEVVDAAAARIAEDGDSDGDEGGDGGEGGEKASALRAQLAAMQTANAALASEVKGLTDRIGALMPLAEQHATRAREDAVDAEMKSRGMPTHDAKGQPSERRSSFQKLAKEHGLDAAKAAITASFVPPSGAALVPPAASRSAAPEALEAAHGAASGTGSAKSLASQRIAARAPLMADLAKRHPKASEPQLIAIANEQLKQTHPHLFEGAN